MLYLMPPYVITEAETAWATEQIGRGRWWDNRSMTEADRAGVLLAAPHSPYRVAVALWIILAIVVWNVTFDRIIVEAGRAYIRAARAAAESGIYLGVGEWMQAAVSHGVWVAIGVVGWRFSTVGLSAIGSRFDERVGASSEF